MLGGFGRAAVTRSLPTCLRPTTSVQNLCDSSMFRTFSTRWLRPLGAVRDLSAMCVSFKTVGERRSLRSHRAGVFFDSLPHRAAHMPPRAIPFGIGQPGVAQFTISGLLALPSCFVLPA